MDEESILKKRKDRVELVMSIINEYEDLVEELIKENDELRDDNKELRKMLSDLSLIKEEREQTKPEKKQEDKRTDIQEESSVSRMFG